MEQYIAYVKLSKKKKREIDRQKRSSWGAINPVTRRPESPRAYKSKYQKNVRRSKTDLDAGHF